ncbi:unnamed protein product, partial [Amoebophrya sp. A25]
KVDYGPQFRLCMHYCEITEGCRFATFYTGHAHGLCQLTETCIVQAHHTTSVIHRFNPPFPPPPEDKKGHPNAELAAASTPATKTTEEHDAGMAVVVDGTGEDKQEASEDGQKTIQAPVKDSDRDSSIAVDDPSSKMEVETDEGQKETSNGLISSGVGDAMEVDEDNSRTSMAGAQGGEGEQAKPNPAQDLSSGLLVTTGSALQDTQQGSFASARTDAGSDVQLENNSPYTQTVDGALLLDSPGVVARPAALGTAGPTLAGPTLNRAGGGLSHGRRETYCQRCYQEQ